jgi:SAM-dependent methyltransferase
MTRNTIISPFTRQLLNVGCGQSRREQLPLYFQSPQWQEIRLDLDPLVKPDINASIIDMGVIADGSIDAIWSSHNLEHLNFYEVPLALAEFKRILKPNGFSLINLPNLRAVAQQIVDDKLLTVMYESAAGPITAMDIVFGHQASIARGNAFMAHRTGFTGNTLGQALLNVGFNEVRVYEGKYWDLWAIATMPDCSEELFNELIKVIL